MRLIEVDGVKRPVLHCCDCPVYYCGDDKERPMCRHPLNKSGRCAEHGGDSYFIEHESRWAMSYKEIPPNVRYGPCCPLHKVDNDLACPQCGMEMGEVQMPQLADGTDMIMHLCPQCFYSIVEMKE